MRLLICTILAVLFSTIAFGQLDSIQQLETVYITDPKLKNYSEGFDLQHLKDSTLQRNTYALTHLLAENANIYFRENGYGMVSSAAFRGTNASQTAVIWNGISINSILTGQTDFNIIMPNSLSEVTVRPGGGSAAYGSGAVGGSVHLTNDVKFRKENKNNIKLGYGSFDTFFGNFKTQISNKQWYGDLAADYINSKNDYKYLGANRKNENGEFEQFNGALTVGYHFGKHIVSLHSNYFQGDRNFSGTLTAPSQDNYRDTNTRNLLTWEITSARWKHQAKAAHLYEEYKYYPNKDNELYFQGNGTTWLAQYKAERSLAKDVLLTGILNYTYLHANGSNIGSNYQNTLALIFLAKHKVSDQFTYGLNVRQEFLNDFDHPLLFGVDGLYKFSSRYWLSFNGSRNFRVPAFNDLFWDAGGNAQLNPEESYQLELGNSFLFRNFNVRVNGFYITSNDLIKWQPNTAGIWQPFNISETENYGVEFSANYKTNFGKHIFNLTSKYSYTKALDKEKNTQLIYVPFHTASGTIQYAHKKLIATWRTRYTGEVFTTTDNMGTVDNYTVSNLDLEYQFILDRYPITAGLSVNNIFNNYYQNVAFRPMPNRNLQINLTLKF